MIVWTIWTNLDDVILRELNLVSDVVVDKLMEEFIKAELDPKGEQTLFP